jgi:hypothetical protein
MKHHSVMLAGAGAVLFASASTVRAQGSSAAPTPACALLSVAELREITGNNAYPDHVDGDKPGEGLGGGSSCQYGGSSFVPGKSAPLVSLVLIPNTKGEAASVRSRKPREGCKREDVPGVGDDALYEACTGSRGPVLYVTRGMDGMLVQLDAKPATDPAAKATVIAIAKAAVPKIK